MAEIKQEQMDVDEAGQGGRQAGADAGQVVAKEKKRFEVRVKPKCCGF